MTIGCPNCNHIFKGDWPCPNCKFKGPYIPPRSVFDLGEETGLVEYEQVHPKLETELHG